MSFSICIVFDVILQRMYWCFWFLTVTFASPSIRELDESEDWVYFYLATSLF